MLVKLANGLIVNTILVRSMGSIPLQYMSVMASQMTDDIIVRLKACSGQYRSNIKTQHHWPFVSVTHWWSVASLMKASNAIYVKTSCHRLNFIHFSKRDIEPRHRVMPQLPYVGLQLSIIINNHVRTRPLLQCHKRHLTQYISASSHVTAIKRTIFVRRRQSAIRHIRLLVIMSGI